MNEIRSISALIVHDSRGHPTVAVTVTLDNHMTNTACVRSGVSRGKLEARDLSHERPNSGVTFKGGNQ